MSFINGSPLATLGGTPAFDYERPQNESTQLASLASSQYGDGFGRSPIALPIQSPIEISGYPGSGSASDAPPGCDPASQSAFFTSIMNSLSNLMQQIASYFGGSSAGTGSSAGSGSSAGGGTTYGSTAATPQTMYSSATASSVGDPHDAFDGTTSQGATVADKWDSMHGHADLLDSGSFHGGYTVSTTATTPNASGVAYNASATVTTHDGETAVTLNKDGSYAVTSDGRNVSLTQGEATQLGQGESVTLNADNSLTIVDSDHQGGSITTSLSENGNGVDVKATASNVELGGYLVNKSDRDADPVAFEAPNAGGYHYAGTNDPPYQKYASQAEPLGAGELEFA